jgi:hypothetical protein
MSARTLAVIWIFVTWPARSAAGIRDEQPNQIVLELGGRMPLIGVDYERWMSDFFGLGIGIGGFPCIECGSANGDGYLVATFPLYLCINLPLAENHGISLSTGATLGFPGHGQSAFAISWVAAGYQLLSDGGFVLRPSVLLFFNTQSEGHIPLAWAWVGLQIGTSF